MLKSLKDPVSAYIDHKLSTLEGRKGYTKDVLAQIEIEVRQRAENTFLWVWLVFKELDKTDKYHKLLDGEYALDAVKEMPAGLSELYSHMMDMIEGGLKLDPQYCKDVLVATYLTYRPLSLAELAVLVGLSPERTQTIVGKCGSFLTITEETVYLITSRLRTI
jgi:hypothetical protein